MGTAAGQVRIARLQAEQAVQVGDMLARAFVDDPAWVWAVPPDEKRARVLRWFFRAAVRYGLLTGEVVAASGDTGAVILLGPDAPMLDPRALMRVGLWQMVFRAGTGSFSRFLTMRRLLEERHRLDVPPRHYYLWLLGVDPPRQRQGLGSKMLRSVTARADAQGLPCYLDTTRERNLAFYQGHAFAVVHEDDLPGGGPHIWTLRRDPVRP